MPRLSTEYRAAQADRMAAIGAIQKAVKVYGVAAVAEKVKTHVRSVQMWNAGEHLPSVFVARRILKAYPGEKS